MVAERYRQRKCREKWLFDQILESTKLTVREEPEVQRSKNRTPLHKKKRPKFDLAEMAAQMPKNYRAAEENFGQPMGREEW